MKLLSLAKEHLDKYWPEIKEYIQSGLMLTQNEVTIDQLRLLCSQGHAHIVLFQCEETYDLKGALVFEVISYPQYRVANVISIGGDKMYLDEHEMDQFKVALKKGGISKIQGWCSPAVARLWQKQYKATIPYQMIRIELGE
jgi:hypothetical protein